MYLSGLSSVVVKLNNRYGDFVPTKPRTMHRDTSLALQDFCQLIRESTSILETDAVLIRRNFYQFIIDTRKCLFLKFALEKLGLSELQCCLG